MPDSGTPDQSGKTEPESVPRDRALDILAWILSLGCLAFLIFLGVLVYYQWHHFTVESTDQVPNLSTLFTFAQDLILAVGFVLTGQQIRLASIQNKATEEQSRQEQAATERQMQQQDRFNAEQVALARQQMDIAEKWKVREFVTNEIRIFNDDPSVVNVKRLLDSMEADFKFGAIVTVNKALEAASSAEKSGSRRDLINALTPAGTKFAPLSEDPEPEEVYTDFQSHLSYEFDRYFSYLISFDGFLETKAVTWKALEGHLYYWLELTFTEVAGKTDSSTDQGSLRKQLSVFIDYYYPGSFENLKAELKAFEDRRNQPKGQA